MWYLKLSATAIGVIFKSEKCIIRVFQDIYLVCKYRSNIDGLMQDRCNYKALAMELHLLRIKPSICTTTFQKLFLYNQSWVMIYIVVKYEFIFFFW